MALSGTLQNFAGGVMILLFKPYRVGDYIVAQGYEGTVKEIQIFNTILNTPDNKTIIIPNGGLSTGSINNFSKEATRRLEWKYGIAYGDSFDTAKAVLTKSFQEDARILKTPGFFYQSVQPRRQCRHTGSESLGEIGRLLERILRHE